MIDHRTEAGRLRLALLALGGLAGVATAAELATERHWGGFIQLIPWIGLIVIAALIGVVLVRRGHGAVWAVRLACLALVAASAFGVYKHIAENHTAGPLDFRYQDSWATLSGPSRWWKAATKTVGPAPVLAPGALAFSALCVALATWGAPEAKRSD